MTRRQLDDTFFSYYEEPKFKKLFEEYLNVITDTNERKKYLEDKKLLDKWITNNVETALGTPGISGLNGDSSTVILGHPEGVPRVISVLPGFSLSVTGRRYFNYDFIRTPIFVNIAHHESIPAAKSKRKCVGHTHSHVHGHDHAHSEGSVESLRATGDLKKDKLSNDYWVIPYSLAPPEKFRDCKVYCIVFGTITLNKSRKNDMFKTTLIRTAFQAIQENFDENIDFNDFVILDTPFFQKTPVGLIETNNTPKIEPAVQTVQVNLAGLDPPILPNSEAILKAKQFIDPFFNVLSPKIPFYHTHVRGGCIGEITGRKMYVPEISIQQTMSAISVLLHQPNIPEDAIHLIIQPNIQIGKDSFSNMIIGTFSTQQKDYIFSFQFNASLHLSSISALPDNTLLNFRKSALQYYNYIW